MHVHWILGVSHHINLRHRPVTILGCLWSAHDPPAGGKHSELVPYTDQDHELENKKIPTKIMSRTLIAVAGIVYHEVRSTQATLVKGTTEHVLQWVGLAAGNHHPPPTQWWATAICSSDNLQTHYTWFRSCTYLSQYTEQGILDRTLLEVVQFMNHLPCLVNLFSHSINIRIFHRAGASLLQT